ncbi:MAG: DUF4132 domain-containing protein [Holophagales bacterium]|nr:DUF4132 domain-containing protein [Holophagales bacterium]
MRRFEFQEGTSSKFWEIELSGSEVTTSWGRIGTTGQSKTKAFETAQKAQSEHDALVKEKVGKGYLEAGAVSVAPATPLPQRRPAAVTTPPKAPEATERTGPPAKVEDAPEERGIAWTDTLRRKVHPRRSTGCAPVRVDAKASWQKIREHWSTIASVWTESPTLKGGALAGLLGSVIRKLDSGDGPPVPENARDEGALFLVLSHRQTWESTSVTNPVVDYWVAECGAPFAVEALVASLTMESGALKAAATLERGESVDWSYSPRFGCGKLTSFAHLRRILAGVPEATWEDGRARAERLRDGATPRCRAALSYLFPDVKEWAEADAREVLAADSWPRWAGSLLASVRDGKLLEELIGKVGASSSYLLPSLDGWSPITYELCLTMLDGAGQGAIPAVARLFDLAGTTEVRRDVAEALSIVRTEEGVAALLARIEFREALAAAGEIVSQSPGLSLGPLAALVAGGGSGKAAEPLLTQLVRQAGEVVEGLLPSLPESSRRTIAAARARSGPVREEAAAADLPPVLANPPWKSKRERRLETVLDLSPLSMPESVVWPAGLRETWAETKSYWSRNLPQGDDGEVLNRLGLAELRKDLPRMPDSELFARVAAWKGDRQFSSGLLCSASERLAITIWEAAPPGRWSDYDTHFAFLAKFERRALAGLLRVAEASLGRSVCTFLPFRTTRLAPFVAEALSRLKSTRGDAQRWLLAHPEEAAAGLVPAAVGPIGKSRAAAAAALRFLATSGHEETLLAVAGRYGEAAREAIQALFSSNQLDVLPAKLPKLPGFYAASGFTRPVLRNTGRALPAQAVEDLGTMLAISRLDEPYGGVAQVKDACEPDSLAAFAWDLFNAWIVAGTPSKEAWAFEALGHLGDDSVARRLAPLIRQWPGEAAHARAVLGLDVLAAIGSDVALMHLNGIAQKVKFKGLQEKAREKIEVVAERRGLTAEEMADRLVPDLGLDDDGSMALDFGPRTFRVGFDEHLKPFVRDGEGKRLPELPKPAKADDAEKALRAVEAWKALRKDVKTVAAQQLLRLELAMCGTRRFASEVFRGFFVQHPLVTHVVRRLVWGSYAGGKLLETFRVAEDGTFADAADETFTLPDLTSVGVVHPLELTADQAARWGQLFGEYEILQPFRQLGRETYAIRDEERTENALARFEGTKVPTGKVLGLEQRGWRRGAAQDGGCSWWYERPLPGNLEAHLLLDPGIVAGMAMEFPEQTLGKVTIERPGTWGESGVMPFGQLDAILFSELVRDLEGVRA